MGDVAFWTADNLTIRGVGEVAHLRVDGSHAGGKAIWVIQGVLDIGAYEFGRKWIFTDDLESGHHRAWSDSLR